MSKLPLLLHESNFPNTWAAMAVLESAFKRDNQNRRRKSIFKAMLHDEKLSISAGSRLPLYSSSNYQMAPPTLTSGRCQYLGTSVLDCRWNIVHMSLLNVHVSCSTDYPQEEVHALTMEPVGVMYK
jgi:hypothetical protein